MLINEKSLKHWVDNFYGYGSWEARFWFVGHEESGGDFPEEAAEKFDYFYKTHSVAQPTLTDIRAMFSEVGVYMNGAKADLFHTLHQYRFEENAVQHGVWKNLIAFVHGYNNKKLPDLIKYQRNSIAQPSSQNEALIPLYPLPTHSHAWYYSWLDMPHLRFLRSRALFQEHVYQQRMQVILQNITRYKPEVVMMYAMENINGLKATIQQAFPPATFKMVKGTKLEIPQHHRADINGTTLIITTQLPALRHNRIETGFDWEAFGKLVKAGN